MNSTLYIGLTLELILLTVYDLITKKIPNVVIIFNLIMFVFVYTFSLKYTFNWHLFLYPLSFIAIGFFLFKYNIMGAGDSKLLASIFLFVPLSYQEIFLNFLLNATIVVGLSFFLINFLSKRSNVLKAIKKRNIIYLEGIWGTKFPFVPVIILAWLWFGWRIYLKK